MLDVRSIRRYERDVERMKKRGKKISKLDEVVNLLRNGEKLDPKYRDHQLTGEWSKFRECHIEPDWLLIYMIQDEQLLLILTRTGSHSDLRF